MASRLTGQDNIANLGGLPDARPMTPRSNRKGSDLLRRLLAEYLDGGIDTQLFCSNFEEAYSFGHDRKALTEIETSVFSRLFAIVVCFSPYPEERRTVPQYQSEDQVLRAARTAVAALEASSER